MPELPEVEVVKRSLESLISNLTIKAIKINEINLRYKVKTKEINQLVGLELLKIRRRSKYLLFFFTKDIIMISHLGMTGKFFFINKKKIKKKTSFYYNLDEKKDNKHNHISFTFKNGSKLIYNDVRKFGFIKIDKIKNLKENSHLKTLGPEPLEKLFNFTYAKNYLSGKKGIIKDLLMDQKFVAGLGNIYVNEILFFSGINPIKRANNLLDIEIREIIKNTKKILRKAIKFGGSSIKDFKNSLGRAGSFQQCFSVYAKKGKYCSNTDCKEKIKKIVLSNRPSFFCPKCQK